MSKKTKLLWAGLIIGVIGIIVSISIAIGTDALMSREAEETFMVSEPFESIKAPDTEHTTVKITPARENRPGVVAYIKAWRPEQIDIKAIVSVDVNDGVLTITETPFPNDFLGMFPQPYELKLTVYAPQAYFEGGSAE